MLAVLKQGGTVETGDTATVRVDTQHGGCGSHGLAVLKQGGIVETGDTASVDTQPELDTWLAVLAQGDTVETVGTQPRSELTHSHRWHSWHSWHR
jgi:hypothetical protein